MIKYISWQLGEKILRTTIGFVIAIWLANVLLPAEYAEYSLVLSYITTGLAFLGFGLEHTFFQRVILRKFSHRYLYKIFKSLVVFRLVLSILILSIVFTFFDYETEFKLVVCVVYVLGALNLSETYLKGQKEFVLISQILMFTLFVFSALKATLLISEIKQHELYASIGAIEIVIPFLLFTLYLKKTSSQIKLSKSRKLKIILLYLKKSWPLYVGAIALSSSYLVDQIMIERMAGSEELGNYAAAMRFYQPIVMILIILITTLVSEKIKSEKAETKKGFMYIGRIAIISSSLIAGIIFVFSQKIIAVFLAEEYSDAAAILAVMCLNLVFLSHFMLRGQWFLYQKNQSLELIAHTTFCILNLIFNYACIKSFGAIGAAYGTLAASVITTLIPPLISKRFKIFFYIYLGRAI